MKPRPTTLFAATLYVIVAASGCSRLASATADAKSVAPKPHNVIFILSDDHRHDFMGGSPTAPPWLETPAMDRMAARGAQVNNAFVTTSLCSPSRASILTGQYAHRHGVVDNASPIPPGTVFFPEHLEKAGYQTAFIGKWHMGEGETSDQPRPGFDHWVGFRGHGTYFDPELNFNGERRKVEGYTTDILTNEALAWLRRQRDSSRPFFLYLSHKATHAEFIPAPRHQGHYRDATVPHPATMADTEANYRGKPAWVREQRNSWHGVDFMYEGQVDFDTFYRDYAETVLALDESIGRVIDYVDRAGLGDSTLVVYMSDNGFVLGEHGLIDKRHAYEESIRVPMLVYAPKLIPAGSKVEHMVRNIDIAPTILELAGIEAPETMDGRSVLAALRGAAPPAGKSELLYEYYWEYAFPHTPTTFALRGDRYKFIYYHGLWDLEELYDLQSDPQETNNLVADPSHEQRVEQMRARLFDLLEEHGAMQVPIRRGNWRADKRRPK